MIVFLRTRIRVMEAVNNKKSLQYKLNRGWNFFWQNKWYPFMVLLALFIIVLIFVMVYTDNNGGFLHMNSDDLIQYYPYVSGFFDKLKSGNVSLYDRSLYGGVSFFSAAYYIPLDIFTFIAFLLSFFMENETAYCIMNFMRPVAGALLLYYTFARKFNTKVAFLCALILFCGGTTESYYIFPVYLGICFYAPLAMLLIDLCIEKKSFYYLTLPIYAFLVVLYDFYIAYMLLAFASIYFVATMTATLGNSNESHWYRWKEFFIRFFEFLFFILLGVVIGAFILMPSALYIMHQTSRTEASLKLILVSLFNPKDEAVLKAHLESYWYFNKEGGTLVNFSWRHYFTQWMNMFIPNDPHQLCLVEAGDYIREHATLYMTCGGLIFLVQFFFTKGKYNARLKYFVLLMNILLCIPIFCVIFGFNTQPYLRWFFIPYFLNLYGVAIAMHENNFSLGESKTSKYFSLFIILAGVCCLIYVLIFSPSIFIHYKNTGNYFYLLLIPALISVSLYLIVLLLSITEKMMGKDRIHKRAVPILIFAEFVFATVIIFANVDNTTARYYAAKETNQQRINTMKEIYNYDIKDGYRTNLYTIFGRETTNVNIQLQDANFGRFFQSFYNTPLNTVLEDIYGEPCRSWSRAFNGGYSLISSPVFNVKYVITNENISLPEKYYTLTQKENDSTKYYMLKDDIPFIVYDELMKDKNKLNPFTKQAAILNYGYLPIENSELDMPYIDNIELSSHYSSLCVTSTLFFKEELDNGYYVYDLSNLNNTFRNYDAYMVYPTDSNIRELTHGFMYLTNEIPLDNNYTSLTQLHYNHFYDDDIKNYKYLLMEAKKDAVETVRIYAYKYQVYDEFIEKQNTYTNKSFSLDGSKMTIKVDMPDGNSTRIIKTGYTYSDEWIINNNEVGFKTINIDGGFLGVVVPKGVTNVDLTLNFIPEGWSMGCKLSLVGCIIYAGILIPTVVIWVRKKKRVIE
jgi:hypothetical protein